MSVQATVRAAGSDQQATLAPATVPFASLIKERSNKFFTRVMTALYDSRRREAEKVLHRYRHLNNDLHN